MRIDVNRRNPSSWRKQAWGVEKLHFLQNSKNLGDRKCLGKLRKSLVGHPDTILFSRISRERVFQHPRLVTSVCFVIVGPCRFLAYGDPIYPVKVWLDCTRY